MSTNPNSIVGATQNEADAYAAKLKLDGKIAVADTLNVALYSEAFTPEQKTALVKKYYDTLISL